MRATTRLGNSWGHCRSPASKTERIKQLGCRNSDKNACGPERMADLGAVARRYCLAHRGRRSALKHSPCCSDLRCPSLLTLSLPKAPMDRH